MSLINCPHCGKKVSDTIDECIHCGKQLKESLQNEQNENKPIKYEDLTEAHRNSVFAEFLQLCPKWYNVIKGISTIGILLSIFMFVLPVVVTFLCAIFHVLGIIYLIIGYVLSIAGIIICLCIKNRLIKKEMIARKKFQNWLKTEKNIEYYVVFTKRKMQFYNSIDPVNSEL